MEEIWNQNWTFWIAVLGLAFIVVGFSYLFYKNTTTPKEETTNTKKRKRKRQRRRKKKVIERPDNALNDKEATPQYSQQVQQPVVETRRRVLLPPKRVTNVGMLPLEIQLQILSMLTTRDLCTMGQVSKKYYGWCQDNSLWKALFQQEKAYVKYGEKERQKRLAKNSNDYPSLKPAKKVDEEEQDRKRGKRQKEMIKKIREKLKSKDGALELTSARDQQDLNVEDNGEDKEKEKEEEEEGEEEGMRIWKEKTAEGFKVRRNWQRGEYGDFKLQGHQSSVYALQFHDNVLASGSADGTVKVWDMKSCECLVSVDEHDSGVNTLSWANSCVISGSAPDGSIHIWDLQTIKRTSNVAKETKKDPAALPTGDLDNDNPDSSEEYYARRKRAMSEPQGVRGYVRAYDLYLFHCAKLFHQGVYCSDFLRNQNGVTKLHREIQDEEEGTQQDQVREGLLLATGSTTDSDIKVWNLATESCMTTLTGHRFGLCCLKFESERIVSGSEDSTVRAWDYIAETETAKLFGHTNWVRAICCDNWTVFSGSADKTVKQWDLRSNTNVYTIPRHEGVRALQMDSTKLVVTHWDGVTLTYDLRTFNCFEPLKYLNIVYCMQFDETRIATGSHDSTIQIWDFKDVDLSLYRW